MKKTIILILCSALLIAVAVMTGLNLSNAKTELHEIREQAHTTENQISSLSDEKEELNITREEAENRQQSLQEKAFSVDNIQKVK